MKKIFKKYHINILVILLLFVLLLSGCNFDENEKNNQFFYDIGETATYDNLEVTVVSYEFSNYIYQYSYNKVEKGNRYCIISVKVKNLSTKTKELSKSYSSNYNFSLYYNEDYEYYSTYLNDTAFYYAHDDIAALEVLNVIVCFKVPEEVETNTSKTLKITFSENKKEPDEMHTWILRDNSSQQ